MDYELNLDQQAILSAVEKLLQERAGAARAIALHPEQGYDQALDDSLREAGFTDVALAEETGALEAAIICEAIAASAGVVSYGGSALVRPAVLDRDVVGPIALTTLGHGGPVRFGAQAATWLVLDTARGEAHVASLEPGDSTAVPTSFGYPMGTFPESLAGRCAVLPVGSADRLASWWRVALAVEAAGTMRAALECTVAYLSERRQFGRAIGSFQAVQHRLADCAIEIEASRWLAYEAAYHGAPTEGAATAVAYALRAAMRVFAETHQLSGAIGFTREHDLHVFTMRLQALRLELEGVHSHRRALVAARWGEASR